MQMLFVNCVYISSFFSTSLCYKKHAKAEAKYHEYDSTDSAGKGPAGSKCGEDEGNQHQKPDWHEWLRSFSHQHCRNGPVLGLEAVGLVSCILTKCLASSKNPYIALLSFLFRGEKYR